MTKEEEYKETPQPTESSKKEPEFKQGEVVLVTDDICEVWVERIFVTKYKGLYFCDPQDYDDGTLTGWAHIKKKPIIVEYYCQINGMGHTLNVTSTKEGNSNYKLVYNIDGYGNPICESIKLEKL